MPVKVRRATDMPESLQATVRLHSQQEVMHIAANVSVWDTLCFLIVYYKEGNHPKVGGTRYGRTTKDKIGSLNKVLVYMFYMYNKLGAMIKYPRRAKAFRNALRALNRRFIIFRDRT